MSKAKKQSITFWKKQNITTTPDNTKKRLKISNLLIQFGKTIKIGNPTNLKKMLDKIIDAREIVIHNYLTVEERKNRAIIGD